ncbi:phosphatidate cytidylyltransferase [Lihuaxuella thermophila]|uniref:Phosphatidate cytidylyltransferase n=1 Tax=Lihuaxuella thermophila TaxID=1173111 RepID=A0A1H8JDZ5_9BACL|nr:phosphatidate cytidylyltransferase [Lihuaxuella thermophila]SEN78949.1 phosphatidate cytidylyltransferase [Lihuaxuella thermophila]
MKQRIITGVLGAAGFLLLLMLGGWWFSGLLFVLAVIAFLEYAQMNRHHWKQPPVLIGIAVILYIFALGLSRQHVLPDSFLQDPDHIVWGLVLSSVWIVVSRNHFDIFQMAYLFVGAMYIGYGFSYMMQTIWKPHGLAFLLLVIFVTWANDSGAYFFGKRLGKRKLWPEISPNKTVEGSVAGIIFGMIMSVICFAFAPELGSMGKAVWLGIFISVVGQLGDLIESAWKRTTGVKDSGTMLPGHGGMLDRFDSLLFTFIVLHLTNLV